MKIEKRIEELGFELPEPPKPAAVYSPAVLSDKFVFVSGQTPKDGSQLVYKGRLGKDLTLEDGYKASQIAVLRAISAVKAEVGDLDDIERIVKLTGYVNSSEDFFSQSKVIDGASELLEKIFGEAGKHARVAIGSNVLPGNAAVEIELTVKTR